MLHYSLLQTRQRHLNHLLPRVFSHPPTASNSRARNRPAIPPTFYPTPSAPAPPLPALEYHGPRKDKDKTKDRDEDSDKHGVQDEDTSRNQVEGNEKGKSLSKRAERAARLDELAPAHEIDCIARVTVSIGAFSYADTEVWIGQFVDPEAYIKPTKIKEKEKKVTGPRPSRAPIRPTSASASATPPPRPPPHTASVLGRTMAPRPVQPPRACAATPYRPHTAAVARPPPNSTSNPNPSIVSIPRDSRHVQDPS